MENDLTAGGSSLDKFLSKITTDVLRAALAKVSDKVVEMDDEDIILEQLNDESFKDSVLDTSSIHYPDFPEIKPNLEEIAMAYVHERCCKLVEDAFVEVHDELRRIFDSTGQEMSSDVESSKKKLRVLDCIKDSDRLQAYFQELSLGVVQSSFDKIKTIKDNERLDREPDLANDIGSHIESDIATSILNIQGSELSIEQNSSNNIDNFDTGLDVELNHVHESSLMNDDQSAKESSNFQVDSVDENEDLNIDSGQSKSVSTSGSLGFTSADSVMYQTAEGSESYNGQLSNQDSFFSANNDAALSQKNGEHSAVDSAMFTTADEFMKDNSSENTFLSFENDIPQDATIVMQSAPGRIADRSNSDIDTTLSEIAGPRQSTPLVDDNSHDGDTTLPSAEASNILSEESLVTQNSGNYATEYERTLQELSGDESSLGEPSTPRTLSRQSSAFGNVTLEFDTDWEASMKGLQEEAGLKPKSEEKHRVILHELSFEDHHRLKAPELLCPVFLAVQDDDDEDEDDERKRKKRMSQSIDDLCEMISEDEDDQDLPSRRRAMSLECKRPPGKEQRKKAPTRDELMAAFEELQNEIMEEKDLEQEREEEVEKPSEEDKEERKGRDEDSQERYGLDDPLRWHTVVFNGQHKVIDLKLLEPFLKVLTHGGYHHEGDKKTVIVVLTACNLPNKKMKRYPFLMEQLFFFIISTMDLLVTSEEYVFVYFHGGTSKNQSPSFSWLKKYYQYIDHRLRKSVTKVYVVHPNLWLKSVFRLCRPFLSSNFTRKLKFVNTLKELSSQIKTDFIFIPDEVIRVDPDYKKIHSN